MTDIKASVSAARLRFLEELMNLGLEDEGGSADTRTLSGEIEYTSAAGATELASIRIIVGSDFPFQRPRVYLLGGEGGLTWHKDHDGQLCLWADDEPLGVLPWRDAHLLLERIRTWLRNAETGWPTDSPVLDLERYLPSQHGSLVVDRPLDSLVDNYVTLSRTDDRGGPRYRIVTVVARPNVERRRRNRDIYGWIGHLGELTHPFADWTQLRLQLPAPQREELERFISMRLIPVVVLGYTLASKAGFVALHVGRGAAGAEILGVLEAVPSDASALTLRGGPQLGALSATSAAVVGVGAVGSLLGDQLTRHGIGRLHLVDGDHIRPGNCIRHLITDQTQVFENKAEAVANHLRNYALTSAEISATPDDLTTIDEGLSLFERYDLVIDATASGTCSALLAWLASQARRPLLAVNVQRGGGVIRVDRWPLESGEDHDPALAPSTTPMLLEVGCADPVSPTPPGTATIAAVLTCRLAIAVLVSGCVSQISPTTWMILDPQPDSGFERPGFLGLR
jgi:hypothetical protein